MLEVEAFPSRKQREWFELIRFPDYFQQFRHQLNGCWLKEQSNFGLKNRVIINIITTITISNKIMLLPKVPKEQAELKLHLARCSTVLGCHSRTK